MISRQDLTLDEPFAFTQSTYSGGRHSMVISCVRDDDLYAYAREIVYKDICVEFLSKNFPYHTVLAINQTSGTTEPFPTHLNETDFMLLADNDEFVYLGAYMEYSNKVRELRAMNPMFRQLKTKEKIEAYLTI